MNKRGSVAVSSITKKQMMDRLFRAIRCWEQQAKIEDTVAQKSPYARGAARALITAADTVRGALGMKRIHDVW